MSDDLKPSESYQLGLLKNDFERCEELLDDYFEPWIVRIWHLISVFFVRLRNCSDRIKRFRVFLFIPAAAAILAVFSIVFGTLHIELSVPVDYSPAVFDRSTVDALGDFPGSEDTDNNRIDVNTADLNELIQLPGIGPVLAKRIMEERAARGAFHYPADLLCVSGIGEKTLAKLIPLITFGNQCR